MKDLIIFKKNMNLQILYKKINDSEADEIPTTHFVVCRFCFSVRFSCISCCVAYPANDEAIGEGGSFHLALVDSVVRPGMHIYLNHVGVVIT